MSLGCHYYGIDVKADLNVHGFLQSKNKNIMYVIICKQMRNVVNAPLGTDLNLWQVHVYIAMFFTAVSFAKVWGGVLTQVTGR